MADPIEEPISVEQEQQLSEVVEVEESPTKEANGDDLADLFEAPSEEDPEMQTDDLTDIDVEEDVIGGDMADLFDVSNDDVVNGAKKRAKKKVIRVRRTALPYPYRPIGGVG